MKNDLEKMIEQSRILSWKKFGKNITFYHPGMFWYNGSWGDYPALSITGKYCELQCDHCKGKILESMISVSNPRELVQQCEELKKKGNTGCLISGGSHKDGTLPWENFIPAIRTVKETLNLHISIHCGIINLITAKKLKKAGVDQALIDVIGDDETFRNIYHCSFGIDKIEKSLDALRRADVPIIPHIVVGLNYGKIKGEYHAIEMVKKYNPEAVTIVALMPLKDTPMENTLPPSPKEIARVIATARIEMPSIPISLGCARDRSNPEIDVLAVECGVNRIALPSDEAIDKVKEFGLTIKWEKTCCSVPLKEREI
ncbi:MAG: radical SAM protein [Thermoplasmatales archaeon]|nr:MAG: radical SAM protein [Thermoplasmatales archaeon]